MLAVGYIYTSRRGFAKGWETIKRKSRKECRNIQMQIYLPSFYERKLHFVIRTDNEGFEFEYGNRLTCISPSLPATNG